MNASPIDKLSAGRNVMLRKSQIVCFVKDAMMADGDQGCKSMDM
ncbi:MAG: hypothetical protein WKF77_26700 [Planctomycetaceae bacterium]